MLLATSDRTFGPSRLRSILVLERRFRVHLVMRDRLVYDTRFAARGIGGALSLYFVIKGHMQIASGEILCPGRAYLLPPSEFERVEEGATKFRTWGEPSVVLDMLIRQEDVRIPIGITHGPVALSEATWTTLNAMGDAVIAGTGIDELFPKLLEGLATDGIISSTVAASVQAEPEQLVRLWSGLRPLYTNQLTSASIFEIKKVTGMSIRQLARDIKLLTRTFGLPGEGFRDTAKVMRLRTAVILLSSPGATATEVARQIGYKSLEAMGRAFRDAGLPAPSLVHEQVRFEAMPAAT